MRILISTILILTASLSNAQFSLVWSDEFDGNSLDLTKWTFDLGAGGWGNNEPQYYTNSANNIVVDTGYLRITARNETIGNSNYTSARIKTQGLFDICYGKIEARMKVPVGKGLWPAFWMLGSNITSVSWPQCGEIDIMEHVSTSPYVNGTYHYNNNGHVYFGGTKLCDVGTFQVYSIEWDAASIRWYLNGVQYYQANILNGINSTEEFHLPFFLILNLATGGNWPGYPDATTVFPANMFVDYVRVYADQSAQINANDMDQSVRLFPNPSKDCIHLETNSQGATYTLFSTDGKFLDSGEVLNGKAQIDIQDLQNGIYRLEIISQDGNKTQKQFVKE